MWGIQGERQHKKDSREGRSNMGEGGEVGGRLVK